MLFRSIRFDTLEDEDLDQRRAYRLTVREPLPVVQIKAPKKMSTSVSGGFLLDISHSGMGLWLPIRPNAKDEIQFMYQLEGLPVNPEKNTVNAFSRRLRLGGVVMNVSPMEITHLNRTLNGFRIGVKFSGVNSGPAAFNARQLRYLQDRAKEDLVDTSKSRPKG